VIHLRLGFNEWIEKDGPLGKDEASETVFNIHGQPANYVHLLVGDNQLLALLLKVKELLDREKMNGETADQR
jgi:hypothetical protein